MKKIFVILLILLLLFPGCAPVSGTAQIAATTLPVYEFTVRLCQGTNIQVTRLITESISCLHDYTLQVWQMRSIEAADVIVQSGAGLEEFLEDALICADAIIDSSKDLELICGETTHDHEHAHDHEHDHHHDQDPHIWLSPANAKIMAQNICDGLKTHFPDKAEIFQANMDMLAQEFDTLEQYAEDTLSQLSCRELITFHDGFAYLAEAFGLTILKAIEEESGSEASAAEIIELVEMVEVHQLPAIFIEHNGSPAAASIIAAETGVPIFELDMAMSADSYFDAMYHNIDTLKEALA